MGWSQIDAVRWIMRHPLNRDHQTAALLRWTVAQLQSQLLRRTRLVNFIGDTRLYIGPGLTAANMQHYAGLGELDVMGFLLHYLRPSDMLVDVGANVGAVTVLASGVGGSRSLAIEPDPTNFKWLERNVAANDLGARVKMLPLAVGERAGTLRLTADLGAGNRVASNDDKAVQVIACEPLDALCSDDPPTVLKADIEGFELPVLRGALAILANPCLDAAILELKNHGARYGFDEAEVFLLLHEYGFQPFTYDPLTRQLTSLSAAARRPPNTIFLRDPVKAKKRLLESPRHRLIWGQKI